MPISDRTVSRVFSLPFMALAVWLAWVAETTPVGWSDGAVAIVLLCAALSAGLWRDDYWARKVGGIALLGAAALVPLMPFLPYPDREMPSIGATLLWLVPVELALLAGACVIDRERPRS